MKLGKIPTRELTLCLLILALLTSPLIQADSQKNASLCVNSVEAESLPIEEVETFVDFVDRCPMVEFVDDNGWTDMHWAATLNLPQLIRQLATLGLPIDIRTKSDEVRFTDEITNGIRKARNRWQTPLVDDEATYASLGYTPLHWAAWGNSMSAAQEFVRLNADTNAKTVTGVSPLHLAVYAGSVEVMLVLIHNDANINAKEKDGATPLHWTVSKNAIHLTRLLIDNGADVDAAANFDATPLHWAAIGNTAKVTLELINGGADVNAKSVNGITPLHLAAWHDSLEVAKLLIQHGADQTAQTTDGQLPIHGAIANEATATAEFLLQLLQ